MPILTININKSIDTNHCSQVIDAAIEIIAEMLNKPKGSILVMIRPESSLKLGETGEPAAFVEFKLFDFENRAAEYVKVITEFIQENLAIAPDRQFLDFTKMDPAMFGWNGKTC